MFTASQISRRRPPRLVWAIRESFLDYLSHIEDTVVTLNDQVQHGVPEKFVFPLEQPITRDCIQARGQVRISAYEGELNFTIANPQLRLARNSLTIFVERQTEAWIPFARVSTDITDFRDAVDKSLVLKDPLLTLAGSDLFGTAYGPGTRLAPLHFERSLPHSKQQTI